MEIGKVLLGLLIYMVCPVLAIRCLQCVVMPTATPLLPDAPAQLMPGPCPVWNMTDCDLRPVPLGLGPFDACYQMESVVDGKRYLGRDCVHYNRCLERRDSLRHLTQQHPGARVKVTCCFQDGCNAVTNSAVTMATVSMGMILFTAGLTRQI